MMVVYTPLHPLANIPHPPGGCENIVPMHHHADIRPSGVGEE